MMARLLDAPAAVAGAETVQLGAQLSLTWKLKRDGRGVVAMYGEIEFFPRTNSWRNLPVPGETHEVIVVSAHSAGWPMYQVIPADEELRAPGSSFRIFALGEVLDVVWTNKRGKKGVVVELDGSFVFPQTGRWSELPASGSRWRVRVVEHARCWLNYAFVEPVQWLSDSAETALPGQQPRQQSLSRISGWIAHRTMALAQSPPRPLRMLEVGQTIDVVWRPWSRGGLAAIVNGQVILLEEAASAQPPPLWSRSTVRINRRITVADGTIRFLACRVDLRPGFTGLVAGALSKMPAKRGNTVHGVIVQGPHGGPAMEIDGVLAPLSFPNGDVSGLEFGQERRLRVLHLVGDGTLDVEIVRRVR